MQQPQQQQPPQQQQQPPQQMQQQPQPQMQPQGPYTAKGMGKGGCVGKGPTDTEPRTAAFNRKGEVNPYWDPVLVAGLAHPFQPMDTLRQIELERNDPIKLIQRIQPTRTAHFTDKLLREMDMKNLYRIARLSPIAC